MSEVIKTKCGELLNLRMVMGDKSDEHGHDIVIKHINNLEHENKLLKTRIQDALAVGGLNNDDCLYDIMCILNGE